MKAKHFKIGDYIADSECEPYFFKVEEIKKNEQGVLAVYYRNGSCMSIDAEPIPLTQEWLLKFGFEKTKQTKEDNNIWTFIGSECKFELEQIITFFLYDNKCFGTELKYVHQLQNLYFALTNEELTLIK